MDFHRSRDVISSLLSLGRWSDFNPDDLGNRDVEFMKLHLDWMGAVADRWFRLEVSGLENLPPFGRGPILAIGNHNAAPLSPEVTCAIVTLARARGLGNPCYGLVHDMVLRPPFEMAGRLIAKFGGLRASRANALAALRAGALLLTYPGGGDEASRAFRRRGEIDFCGRSGWAKIALELGAPIVPVVASGAHEALVVLSEGRALARLLGLRARLRVDHLPLCLGLPWGLWLGAWVPFVPLPTKIRLSILPPIPPHGDPERRGDVLALAERVRTRMQDELTRLEAGRRHFVLG